MIVSGLYSNRIGFAAQAPARALTARNPADTVDG